MNNPKTDIPVVEIANLYKSYLAGEPADERFSEDLSLNHS